MLNYFRVFHNDLGDARVPNTTGAFPSFFLSPRAFSESFVPVYFKQQNPVPLRHAPGGRRAPGPYRTTSANRCMPLRRPFGLLISALPFLHRSRATKSSQPRSGGIVLVPAVCPSQQEQPNFLFFVGLARFILFQEEQITLRGQRRHVMTPECPSKFAPTVYLCIAEHAHLIPRLR